MTTRDDAKPDKAQKKKSGTKKASKQLKKFFNPAIESAAPDAPTKHTRPHSPGVHAQNHATAQGHKPPANSKHPNAKSDVAINKVNKLNQEFADMKRGLSADAKTDTTPPLPAAPYETKVDDLKQVRHVMDTAQIPTSSRASHDAGSILPFASPLVYSTPPIETMIHSTIVAEPEIIPTSIPGRSPRRPSMSQQIPNRPFENSMPSDVYPRQGPRQNSSVMNGHASESLEALRSELEVAQYKRQELQRDLERMTQTAMERGRQIAHMQRSQEAMAAELTTARHNCERSIINASKLEDDIAQARGDLRGWQDRFDMVNNELLQLRSGLDKHISDKWFQTQWEDLNTKIEAVSNQYFIGRQSRFQGSILSRGKGTRPDKLEIHPSLSLTRLTNEHAWYLGSEHERPLIIQAFIWWVLVNRIFAHMACDEWGFFWAGQSRDLLYHLKRQVLPPRPRDWPQSDPATLQRLEADAGNYHKWRATTAMMLLARNSVDKRIKTIRDLIEDLVGDVSQAVSPYIVVSKGKSPNAAEDGFCKQLEAVFVQAIKLDADMAQQRAWVYCEPWRAPTEGDPLWGFTCRQDEAEVIQTADQVKGRRAHGNCVELVVQPALFREGNQYGEEYSRKELLCKAKIVMGETSLLALPHR